MNISKISPELQTKFEQVLANYPLVLIIAQTIAEQGGRTLLVGGAVRDLMLDLPVKDLDIEVHGITLEQLEKILRTHGAVDLVGKSFGVLRLGILDVDWALPRSDSSGRKPQVIIDSVMAFDRAFARRDLTINAMGIDLISHELIDPFNGAQDLHNKILRAPDPQLFLEDPLRFFRVMQFIARFEMHPDQTLTQVCQQMDISAVSRERIEAEFEKMLLKSVQPSLGIRWLHDIGRLHEVLPEIAALVGVKQSPVWHPEGDVFEHTMQAVDASAHLNYQDPKQKLLLLYAALCHDVGKAVATQINGDTITSYNHEVTGVPIAKKFLRRITHNTQLIDDVSKLVRYHMAPVAFVKSGAKLPAYKRLAHNLAPLSLQFLADLSWADKSGRNPQKNQPLEKDIPEIKEFLAIADKANVRLFPEPPLLLGRDIADIVLPGPAMGKFLARAYELQIEQGINDKQELKQLVLTQIKKD